MASPLPVVCAPAIEADSRVADETTQAGARRHRMNVRRKGDTTSPLHRETIRDISCRKTGRIPSERRDANESEEAEA
jgi:hypothetical protein